MAGSSGSLRSWTRSIFFGIGRADGIAHGSSHESDSSKAWPAAAWAVRKGMARALISATRRSQRIVASCRDRSLQTLPRPRGAPAHGSLRKSRQAPVDSPVATATEGRWIQSVTRGGFGRRDGCDTCVDLDGRKRASRCDESLPTQRMLERHEKFRSHHQWQQPPERQFQSVTRGGFGCRDGCYTCVDLDGRKRASRCDASLPTQRTLERHEQIRWSRPWQQPRERQSQSVTLGGFGLPGRA